ncbi:TonB-dependent receptor domain-containing protein [Pseudohongiella spirulinae]|uniref:TonB-dependent receptor n=1 Tax=Pseudohongiella spirulinae TaxID=1249552 RepID=A0A0S2KAH7_9GAMM|nr:TonB-dependent receptor [Pseudohongiella spirulinae]ALO45209.1 TonB-dependent receptor [Pseudohongiella spirulinae]
MKKKTLSLAIAGVLGFGGAVVLPANTYAQESADTIEEVVITGSRIRRADLEGFNPVSVIDRTMIETQSQVSLGDILQRMPYSAGAAVNTGVNNGGSGAVNFSLRGLGSQRTLVLVNGRRVVPSGLGANSVVDLNNIPPNMIERVEVLKDGASSVYGSDAVAGVVNIITRKDYNGAALNVQNGITSEGDGGQSTVDFNLGTASDRGSFVVSGYYTKQKPIWAGDREYSKEEIWYHPYWNPTGQEPGGSSAVPWGNHVSPASVGGDGVRYTRGQEFGAWRQYSGASDPYNYAPANYTQTPNERWGFSAFGNYQLGDFGAVRNVEASGEVMFTHRASQRLIAPEPLAPLAFFGTAAPYSDLNYYNITQGPKHSVTGDTMILTDWRRRMVETGGRDQVHETNTHQVTLALTGEVGNWFWDASAFYGENDASVLDLGYFQLERVAEAVGPTFMDASGNLFCSTDGTAAGVIDGCVPLNVFGQPGTDTQITPEMLQYISGNYVSMTLGGNDMSGVQFNASGPIMDLPAGELGMAVGVEHRKVNGFSQPDSLQLLGVSTAGSSLATAGGYNVDEAYVEFAIPVIAGVTGIESLELSLASRYSDYNTFGSTTNSKLGMRWTVNDELTLRATVSEAFRAPSVPELFAGQSTGYPQVSDPCAGNATQFCVADGVPSGGYDNAGLIQLPTLSGGSTALQPEEADILTAGFVYQPGWMQDLSITVDYWETEIDGAVSTLGPQLILDSCQQSGQYCELVERWGPGSGATVGDVKLITNLNVNVGGNDASGIDLSARYSMDTSDWGSFDLGLDVIHLLDYEKRLADGTIIPHAGRFEDNHDGNFPEWRWNFVADWNYNQWTANYTARYIGEVTEPLIKWFHSGDEENQVKKQLTHSVQATYNLESYNTRFTLGVENLTDEQPPFAYSGFNDNTDPRTYETRGRYYYGRVSFSF